MLADSPPTTTTAAAADGLDESGRRCRVERSALRIALKVRTQEYRLLGTAHCFRRWQVRTFFQAALDRLKRLVQQRTSCLEVVRMAYVRDVLSVKMFLLGRQKDTEREVPLSVPPPVPEEVLRAPSADLRDVFSDVNANVDVEVVTRTEHGVFHRAGIGPSTGVLEFPPLIETGEARVDDLSLGIYAPSSHALVIKPCDACLGVSTFIFRRNRRVDEALRRLDRSERLEEQAAVLTASNASLLERLLHTEARLEIAVERLSEAEGSGKNGRDWLVKELARVVQETHVLRAEVLKRDEVVLEIHGQRDREREERTLEAKSAAESFRSRLSSAQEELETVREALLQSNAETRREASKATELENEAFSLRGTVKHLEAKLRGRGRSLAEANRWGAAAAKEAASLKERLRQAREEGAEKELEAGNRLHEANLALEVEERESRRLVTKLDEANATILNLQKQAATVASNAEVQRERGQNVADAVAATANAASSPPPPVPRLAIIPTTEKVVAKETRSTQTTPEEDDAAQRASLVDNGTIHGGGVVDGGRMLHCRRKHTMATSGLGKVRLAAKACGFGIKRGLRLASERNLAAKAAPAAPAAPVAPAVAKAEADSVVRGVPEEKPKSSPGIQNAPTKEERKENAMPVPIWSGEDGGEGEGGAAASRSVVQAWRKRAREAEARRDVVERELCREVSRGVRRADGFASAMDGLRLAVDHLSGSITGSADVEVVGDDVGGEDCTGAVVTGPVGDGAAAAASAAAAAVVEAGEARNTRTGGESAGSNSNRKSSDDTASAVDSAQRAADMLISRIGEARAGVLGLKIQLTAASRRTAQARETREAERVRTARAIDSLRSEAEELRRRPRTRGVEVQTGLKGSDVGDTEALVLALERKNKGAEVEFETFKKDAERKLELENLKAEEEALKADDHLHASHVREGNARAYCQRLEGRVAALMAHREELRQERQVLRAAVRASFKDAADKEKLRVERMRNVSTQVKCSVCAVRGELGAGEDTTPTAHAPTPKAATTRSAAAAAAAAAAPCFQPAGKAWRWTEFPNNDVSVAANGSRSRAENNGNSTIKNNDDDKRPVVRESGRGGNEGGAASPTKMPREAGRSGRSKTEASRRGASKRVDNLEKRKIEIGGADDPAEQPEFGNDDDDGSCERDASAVRGSRAVETGDKNGREAVALPQQQRHHHHHYNQQHHHHQQQQQHSDSSSTSGFLVHRGLGGRGNNIFAGPKSSRSACRQQVSSSASPLSLVSRPRVDALLAGDGALPLAVEAARVQQQRFANVGRGSTSKGVTRRPQMDDERNLAISSSVKNNHSSSGSEGRQLQHRRQDVVGEGEGGVFATAGAGSPADAQHFRQHRQHAASRASAVAKAAAERRQRPASAGQADRRRTSKTPVLPAAVSSRNANNSGRAEDDRRHDDDDGMNQSWSGGDRDGGLVVGIGSSVGSDAGRNGWIPQPVDRVKIVLHPSTNKQQLW